MVEGKRDGIHGRSLCTLKYKSSIKFLQWFRRRSNNGENKRRLLAAIFVDGPGPFSGGHN